MKEEQNKVGARLRLAREILMLTQKEFADRIGMLTSNLSTIENGKRNIGPRILISIEKEFGVNLKWLGTGEGDPFKTYTTVSDKIRALLYLNSMTPSMLAQKIGTEHLNEILDIINHNKLPTKEFLDAFKLEFPEISEYPSQVIDGIPLIEYVNSDCKEGCIGRINKDCKRYKIPIHGVDRIIPVYEDISSEIRKGDYLCLRTIDPNKFIQWEKLHTLDTTQGVIIKKIKPSKKPAESIVCINGNNDFEIPRLEIFGMYLAVAVLHTL